MKKLLIFVFILLAAIPIHSNAGEFKEESLGIAVATHDDWKNASSKILAALNQMSSKGALIHAEKKGLIVTPDHVDAKILLLHSKHEFGTAKDNPNVILAKEKVWTKDRDKGGRGYLDLMQERVRMLRAPTMFIGKPVRLKIGDTVFFRMDAINTTAPKAGTKQRYICTQMGEHYIYFVLSFNDEKDADFLKMMSLVESFQRLPLSNG